MDQERMAMEANAEMMTMMLQSCREKTISKTHSSPDLSQQESQQFQYCLTKFMETPNHIMSAMQQMQGGMQ